MPKPTVRPQLARRLGWLVALALLVVACMGSDTGSSTSVSTSSPAAEPEVTSTSTTPTTPLGPSPIPSTSYESARQLALALIDAGYGCMEAEDQQFDLDGEPQLEGGITSWVACMWPTEENPDLPRDRIGMLIFDSEHDRLALVIQSFVFGCGAAPPESGSLAYVYGEDWLVSTGYGTTDRATMRAVAEDLGGLANSVGCSDLELFLSSLDIAPGEEDPLGDVPTEVLKEGLGEEPGQWQSVPAPLLTIAPAEQQGGIGDVVGDGKFEFVVTGFECGIDSPDDSLGGQPDGQFCVVEFTVTNVGDTWTWKYSYADQALIDDQGGRHRAYFWASDDVFEDLDPGAELRASLVFDVPAEFLQEAFLHVEFHDSLLSPGVLVTLR